MAQLPQSPLIPANAGIQAGLSEGRGSLMFCVYITASGKNGTLYTGHCEDLATRIQQHKDRRFGGFTSRYGADKLVWFEAYSTRHEAFRRERQIKEWKRVWKLKLIEACNPNWVDLFPDIDRLLQDEERRWLSQLLPGSRRSPG